MTKLQRRLAAYKRRKARINVIKLMFDKLLKMSLVIIVLPALVFYTASVSGSISYFTHSTQSEPFYIVDEQPMALFSFVELQSEVNLEIIGDEEIEVPENESIEKLYFLMITENGVDITDAWVYWSLVEEVNGVLIDPHTGTLTVQSSAAAGKIILQADVVGNSAYKSIQLTVPPPEIITVPQIIYDSDPLTVDESAYEQ